MWIKLFFIFLILHKFECNLNENERPSLRELSIPRHLKEGKSIQIHCIIDQGKLPVYFKWYFNDEKLEQTNENFLITDKDDQSTLKIKNLTLSMIGFFKCTVDNEFGSDEQKVNVFFKGKKIVFRNDSKNIN